MTVETVFFSFTHVCLHTCEPVCLRTHEHMYLRTHEHTCTHTKIKAFIPPCKPYHCFTEKPRLSLQASGILQIHSEYGSSYRTTEVIPYVRADPLCEGSAEQRYAGGSQ